MDEIKARRDDFIKKASAIHNNKYSYDKFTYINTSTKGIITCPTHGDFAQTPHNHLAGQGCPECGKKKAKESRKNNYKHFLKTAKGRFGNKYSYPSIQSEYHNSHSKITIICNDCGNEFTKIANDHICSRNGGCKTCLKKENTKLYTYQEILKYNLSGFSIKQFDEAKTKNDKCVAICPFHGEYQVLLSTIIKGKGKCKKCSYKNNGRTMPIKKLKTSLERKYPGITCDYDSFTNMSKKLTFTCVDCGSTFMRSPTTMLHKSFKNPCPNCSLKMISKDHTKTTDEFKKEINALYGNDAFDLSETIYNGYSKKVRVKCNKCGKTISIGANMLLQGRNCPCQRKFNTSRMETEMKNYLKENNIYFFSNDRSILRNHNELDIYLPLHKIAIEFDGLYWHNELNKPRDYHLNKTLECERLGIRLIHIFEDEWNDKKQIVLSSINKILRINLLTIPERQAKAINVDKATAIDFMESNHLLGKANSSLNIGIEYNNEIVSLMSFNILNKNKMHYIISRNCDKLNTFVPEGEKIMFGYFVNMYHPQNVLVKIDRRWNDTKTYEELGFKLYKTAKPDYYYVIGNKRKNKRQTTDNITEQGKIHKIYDCGNFYYIWNNK